MLTSPQLELLSANNAAAAAKDRTTEDHAVMYFCQPLAVTSVLVSGDLARVNQAMRRRFYIDTATGLLYTPGKK